MKSDLSKRLLVALVGVPLAIAAAYIGGWLFTFGVVLLCVFTTRELERFLRQSDIPGIRRLIFIFAVTIPVLVHIFGFSILMFLFWAVFLICGFYSLYYSVESGFQRLLSSFFTTTFLVFPYMTLLLIRDADIWQSNLHGAFIIMYIIGGVWIVDSAAYAIGKWIGKHKMTPILSPKKTIEGGLASVVAGIIWGVLAGRLLQDYLTILDGAIIGFIIGFVSILGDLIESMIKRNVGVKDSGGAFPGHGGVYDRFDSLLFVAPTVYLYMIIAGVLHV